MNMRMSAKLNIFGVSMLLEMFLERIYKPEVTTAGCGGRGSGNGVWRTGIEIGYIGYIST